jgi:hypothetical protein
MRLRCHHALLVAPTVALVVVLEHAARADPPDAGASIGGCVESVPGTGEKPAIVADRFPQTGTSGYAASLVVSVEHGKGEGVLPVGLALQTGGDAARELTRAGFAIPDQDGGAGASLSVAPGSRPGRSVTTLEVPLVLLPKTPGRNTLTLPSFPISVARASGEVATVCTRPRTIVVEDPVAQTPDAKPKPNPPAVLQREEWTALRRAVEWMALGVPLGALLGWALYKFMKRPKPVPPPPPPRPPWEVALEKLDEVRHAGLLETERYSEYFDRVNDTIRLYLGDRYGFDGLESTTDEILQAMKLVPHFGVAIPEIAAFLQECDLVKFARMTPSNEECLRTLDQAERVVRATMPPLPQPAGPVQEVRV